MTIVDGVETITPLSTGREVVLLEQLGGGSHTLTFRRLSEGDNPMKVASLSVFGEDCGFLPPPAAPEKRIEFFGDSITCGFGDLGEAADPDFPHLSGGPDPHLRGTHRVKAREWTYASRLYPVRES